MISLYRDQTVEKIFSDSLYSSHAINNTTTSESPEKIISSLQAKIKELESKLAMKEVSINYRQLQISTIPKLNNVNFLLTANDMYIYIIIYIII